MRICLLTYEYPPDTGNGGIGTYNYQLSRALEKEQIATEVICGSSILAGTIAESGYRIVTKIQCDNAEQFRRLAPGVTAERCLANPFDLIECPEFGAASLNIKTRLPDVPLIIKVHTPSFLIKELNDHYYDNLLWRKLKNKWGFRYSYKNDLEYQAILKADLVTSPSRSLKEIIADRWSIPENEIVHLPYPYYPAEDMTAIQPGAKNHTVLYIGRLETRKDVYNLAKAIPLVLQKIPDTKFVFLGKDSRGPYREKSMKLKLQKMIGSCIDSTNFIEQVPLNEIPGMLSMAHTCIFPSIWENFPNACLEAMSAARSIVGSNRGGMKDMLEDVPGNILVDPHSVSSIAEGIVNSLMKQDLTSAPMQNRQKILTEYGDTTIKKTLQVYGSVLK